MSNFTQNWLSFGKLLLIIAAVIFWPFTLGVGALFIAGKMFKCI